MLRRSDVVELYRLILDRDPESEQVVDEKRRCKSLREVAVEMFTSDEFEANNKDMLDMVVGPSSR